MEADSKPLFSSEVSSKRRHDDDNLDIGDDLEEDAKKRRMPAGHDIGPKLVNMIKKLDEDLNGESVESALEILANTLEENLDPYEGQIIHILYECAAYLPEKITTFSTLVGILNARSSEFGEKLLAKFINELQGTFVNEEYDISIRIITFLCDLGNAHVVNVDSIFDFLEDFVELAVEDNIKSDFFIYSVLHALPWIGPELNDKNAQRLNAMLNKIGIYIAKRKKEHLQILQVWSSDANYPQPDYLDNLWVQMQKLKEANWLETHILRTYVYFNKYLNEAIEHEMPSIDRELIRESRNHPLPRCVFRLFQPSDCIDNDIALPVGDSIERFLVEEDLNWIIDNNYTDWKLCARALLNYYRKETVPLNYVVIEVIFSQLFRLPNSPHLELFYGALLIELCRTQSSSMPQVLALAAEMLYQRTDTMQPICLDRFVDWFSYHLSNFEYRWSWSDWAECVELDSLHPKRIFVREVIDKCMRLSYHKKLLEILPKEFGPIIPDEPNISYILDDVLLILYRTVAFDKAEQLKEMIMQKRSDEDILSALTMVKSEDEPIGAETVYSPDSVAIFFAVLLKLASKTLTHSFAALTRYHKTLSALTNGNEAMQSIILRTLYDSWSLHKQMMTILVDKMIKMKILEPTIVQAWVFSEEMKVEFKRTWVWDVLNSAVVHLEKQSKKLARDGQILAKRLRRLEAQSNSMEQSGQNQNEEGEAGRAPPPRIVGPSNGSGGGDEDERMDFDGNAEEEETTMINDPVEFDERIQRMREQIQQNSMELERNDGQLRMILLRICHKFTLIITEHILNCETDGTEVETNFYNFVIGRFKFMLLKHRESVWKYAADLERELFSSQTIEPRIRQIFEQFKSLH